MSLLLKKHYRFRKVYSNYNYLLFSFFGVLIKKGKKEKINKLLILLLEKIKENFPDKNALVFLLKALEKLKPVINIRVKKVAGIRYSLPCPIGDERSAKVAVAWFYKSLEMRKEHGFVSKAFSEIVDIHRNKGLALQKKQAQERLALDNRAFFFFLKR